MEGTVTSFLPSKGFGFVAGDDGRDYFVHQGDLVDQVPLIDGQRVVFEESATPKGYRARQVRPLAALANIRYVVPEDVTLSRDEGTGGWEVIEAGRWKIRGSSPDSPEDAKTDLQRHAHMIGANGVVGMGYSKSRGAEAGTGHGTHHFTIHHFGGRPVVLGRASTAGSVDADSLRGLDQRAAALKAQLSAQTQRSRSTAGFVVAGIIVGAVVLFLAVASVAWENDLRVLADLFMIPFFAIPTLVFSLLAWNLIAKDHDSWLQPP